MNISKAQLLKMFREFYQRAWKGWITDKEIRDEVDEYLRLAASFPVGAALEKRGDEIRQRQTQHS